MVTLQQNVLELPTFANKRKQLGEWLRYRNPFRGTIRALNMSVVYQISRCKYGRREVKHFINFSTLRLLNLITADSRS